MPIWGIKEPELHLARTFGLKRILTSLNRAPRPNLHPIASRLDVIDW